LTGIEVVDRDGMVEAARRLADDGPATVLIKGGHLAGDQSVDLLVTADGAMALRGPRVRLDRPVHGTGCALSTAIACQLAVGRSLREACIEAKEFVVERLRAPVQPGRGRPSVM
jgi:hydroxymethylpyrimidine/phosphomethylpyrimidine kinase